MKVRKDYFFCSPRLLKSIPEIDEIDACIDSVLWARDFRLEVGEEPLLHQRAYNKAFADWFGAHGWRLQPKLTDEPKLIGDAQKNEIFIEVQFGNSSTIYRDYYKFHYGLMRNLIALAVLIVPTDPFAFFPTRRASVTNMASFELACKWFRLLPLPVPILLIGLLPEN